MDVLYQIARILSMYYMYVIHVLHSI